MKKTFIIILLFLLGSISSEQMLWTLLRHLDRHWWIRKIWGQRWSQFRQPIYHLPYKAMLKENRWSPFVSTSSLAQPIWPKLSELDRLCKLAGGSKRASKLFFIISALFWIINGCRNWLHLCPQIFLTWYWWSRWCDKVHTICYQVRITSKKRRINSVFFLHKLM